MSVPLLEAVHHRPWPPPSRPWAMRQVWSDLLFSHGSVPERALREQLPPGLELELYLGQAWVSLVPFRIASTRLHGLPPLPGASTGLELNLRTYVRHGSRAGVFFLTLEADNPLFVWGARALFHLPYHTARMLAVARDCRLDYSSLRTTEGRRICWRGTYGPVGASFEAQPGTLEHFLAERYCLFSSDRAGRLCRADIHHRPWQLQPAEAAVVESTLLYEHGLGEPTSTVLHFSRRQEVLIWFTERES